MQKGTAPGPEKDLERYVAHDVEVTRQLAAPRRRRRTITRGTYFAMGMMAITAIVAWTGDLYHAIWYAALSIAVFVITLQPVVDQILVKLDSVMEKHHEQMPAVHGRHLMKYCPTCFDLHHRE